MSEQTKLVTIPAVVGRKRGDRIVMMTAYDAPTARLLDQAGVDILLVGDSVAMVVLGHENTLAVTVEEMLHHTRAVVRGRRRAMVVADLPFLSYHLGLERAVENAGRFLKEAGADAVKLEGGRKRVPVVQALLEAEIPVMGHIGLTPQSYHAMGGFRVQGREPEAAAHLLADASALAAAGVFALVLEGIPCELAARITASVDIPTIGIGAGVECDGQVLVFHDVVGLGGPVSPRFVRRYADLAGVVTEAVERFVEDVRAGAFPSQEESYHGLGAGQAESAER